MDGVSVTTLVRDWERPIDQRTADRVVMRRHSLPLHASTSKKRTSDHSVAHTLPVRRQSSQHTTSRPPPTPTGKQWMRHGATTSKAARATDGN